MNHAFLDPKIKASADAVFHKARTQKTLLAQQAAAAAATGVGVGAPGTSVGMEPLNEPLLHQNP